MELVPSLSTPRLINSSAIFKFFTPPEALILTLEPICFENKIISSFVAPFVPKPVEVFI